MSVPPPALEMTGVWRTYTRGSETVRALAGVDLVVSAGEFVSVVGRSGSGKSTLLHIAGGIDLPDRGNVRVLGQDPATLSTRERAVLRRRKVGFVFQFFHLLPQLSVLENVEMPLLLDHADAARGRALEILGAVQMAGRRDRFPSQLSGGEMQRVALARALVTGAPLILADEPTGNLDTTTGSQVLDLLVGQVRERNAALVLVTHDRSAAGRADRVLTLEDGRIASSGMRSNATLDPAAPR